MEGHGHHPPEPPSPSYFRGVSWGVLFEPSLCHRGCFPRPILASPTLKSVVET